MTNIRGSGTGGHPHRRSERRSGTAATPPPLAEVDLRRAILCEGGRDHWGLPNCTGRCLAHTLGWRGMYVKPLMDRHFRWQTPTRGDLGEGWPDLTMVNPRQRRTLFAELKAEGKDPTPEQEDVLTVLRLAGAEIYVWRPADLDSGDIARVLATHPDEDAAPRVRIAR